MRGSCCYCCSRGWKIVFVGNNTHTHTCARVAPISLEGGQERESRQAVFHRGEGGVHGKAWRGGAICSSADVMNNRANPWLGCGKLAGVL